MSTSRIPRLSTAPTSDPPLTDRPSSRTLHSSATSTGYGLSSSTSSRLPSTTGRAPALRSSKLPLSSSLSASTSSASAGAGRPSGLYRSTGSAGSGSGTVLGKRGSGLADLDEDGLGSSINRQIYTTQAKIMGLERTINEHRAKETEHQATIEEQQNEIYKLKSERRMLADRNGKERKSGEEQEGKWYEERTAHQKEISSLRLRLSSLESTTAQLQSERDQSVGELALAKQTRTREIATYKDQILTLQAEVEGLKKWHHRSTSLAIQLEEEKRKAEEREERWRSEKRRSFMQGPAANDVVEGAEGGQEGVAEKQEMQRLRDEIKGLSQKLQLQQNHRKTLETEVVELKKGKKEAETDKRMMANTANDLRLEVRSLREQLQRAQQDMDSLTRTFPETPSSPSVDLSTVQNRLSTLSELHKTTTDDLAATKLELEQTHARLTETTARAHAVNVEMTQRLQTAEMEERWAKEGRVAAERRERLALNELDIVRDTTSRAMPGGGSFGDDAARVSQLEQVVDMYKKQLDEMQRDSQAAEERIVEGRGLVKQAVLDEVEAMLRERQAVIAEQEQRIAELESANATLDAEVSDAARRLASGEYDPSKVRVLEFANNPAAKIKMTRLHELQELKEENEALLQALSELEDAKGLSNDEGSKQGQEDGTAKRYVPRQSFDRLVKEKKDLEESREKRVLRLKEIFGAKSKEFLEAVYSLLGWKIKFDESGRDIRLTSMYAPKGKMGLTLKFASNEGHFGTMQMTGAMAKGLEEARRFWIEERQSVPGFLAQVTTECFEKTTIGRASGYVGLE